MFSRQIVQLAAIVLLLLPAVGAAACEYCVREVGFVALHNEPFRVVITVPPEMEDAQRDRLLGLARAEIGPSNVVVSLGSPDEGGAFTDVADQSGGRLPAAVVYAPDGRNELMYATPSGERGAATTLPIAVGRLTHSSAREGLAAAMIDGYATVLVVEGTDADANAAARELAEQAIQRINAVKSGFDRVIEVGPALRVITAEQREREHWLLWSLGIDSGDEPMPSVAVLYGKGRRLGDVLTGNTLTDNTLFTLLSYVARDCECDLDRTWLYAATFPLVWDDALRRRAYDSLGFDPESAATRAAVARILERGPGSSGTTERDPFIENSGASTPIPGLTIHPLNAPTTNVPPTPVAAATPSDEDGPGNAEDGRATDAASSAVASSERAGPEPSPMRTVLVVLAGLAGAVCVFGGILITKSRGNH